MSRVASGRSAALARQFAPHLVGEAVTERPIAADHTNETVVVGEAVVVKWLRPPVPDPHPGVEIVRHLASVGYTDMPAFLGAHVADGEVVAVLTEFIHGAVDGWTWYVDELAAAIGEVSLEPLLDTARALGTLAAKLHRALGTASAVIPEPRVAGAIGAELERGLALLDEARRTTSGGVADRIESRVDRIEAALRAVPFETTVVCQPIHGDLHIGQVLRNADRMIDSRLLVTDFDGNPVMELHDRHSRRSPLVDVAWLLQSMHHVGRMVIEREGHVRPEVARFIEEAPAAALDAYAEASPMSATDHLILGSLSVVQNLHEFVYAARSLPSWMYVPDAVFTAMFPDA